MYKASFRISFYLEITTVDMELKVIVHSVCI